MNQDLLNQALRAFKADNVAKQRADQVSDAKLRRAEARFLRGLLGAEATSVIASRTGHGFYSICGERFYVSPSLRWNERTKEHDIVGYYLVGFERPPGCASHGGIRTLADLGRHLSQFQPAV